MLLLLLTHDNMANIITYVKNIHNLKISTLLLINKMLDFISFVLDIHIPFTIKIEKVMN